MIAADSRKASNKIYVKRLRNRRRRRLEMKKMKSVCSMNNNSFVHGEGRGRGGGGDCRKTMKRGIKELDVGKGPEKETNTDFSNFKELNFDTSHQSSVSSDYSLDKGKELVEVKPLAVIVQDKNPSLMCHSHGLISVIGRRREMEDAVTVAPSVTVSEFGSYDFYAVYDGHGGASVANACRDRMHQLVAEEIEKGRAGGGKGLDYWEEVMGKCFDKMDEEVGGSGGEVEVREGTSSVKMVGSTAVVVMVGKEEVVVANCGDSRAVLCRGGVAVPLSRDHKPDRPDERERVEAAGGRVINWNGSRVLGVLATSRSIGDHCLRPYVIPKPEVTVNERTELDDFLLIATDGLWDAVSNEIACEIVRKCFDGQIKRKFSDEYSGTSAAEAAAMLAELAMARGSKDNISIVVVELRKSNDRIF